VTSRADDYDCLPDVRDGLDRRQRIVLWVLHRLQAELGRERVPTVMLYGRVVEHLNVSEAELYQILHSLGVAPGEG
jgi:hypothetical protein